MPWFFDRDRTRREERNIPYEEAWRDEEDLRRRDREYEEERRREEERRQEDLRRQEMERDERW